MADENTNGAGGNTESVTFEQWIEKQSDDVKASYGEHVKGLKNTVSATRRERDELKNQLSDALKAAERGSELESKLNATIAQIEAATRRADFMEEAIRSDIGCKNPKVAFALATAEGLFTKTGAADWQAIKAAAPELFGTPGTKANGGSGNADGVKTNDMNAIIRRVAGYS